MNYRDFLGKVTFISLNFNLLHFYSHKFIQAFLYKRKCSFIHPSFFQLLSRYKTETEIRNMRSRWKFVKDSGCRIRIKYICSDFVALVISWEFHVHSVLIDASADDSIFSNFPCGDDRCFMHVRILIYILELA